MQNQPTTIIPTVSYIRQVARENQIIPSRKVFLKELCENNSVVCQLLSHFSIQSYRLLKASLQPICNASFYIYISKDIQFKHIDFHLLADFQIVDLKLNYHKRNEGYLQRRGISLGDIQETSKLFSRESPPRP
jgi:hypothetical protein